MLIKEQNAIRKVWTENTTKIGLVYPNTYRVAMTSFTVQLLYFLFNENENFLCERIFKPIGIRVHPYSLENGKKPVDFDILAISCQFEFDFVQAMDILLRSGINPDVRHRKDTDPLIIAGGPSITVNPFPILFLADIFFLGDIEPVIDQLLEAFEAPSKKEKIEALANIPGVIARGYHYDDKGKWIGGRVTANKVKDLTETYFPIKQIIPDNVKGTKNEPIFGKAYYLETDRGCNERCNFCMIGHCRFPRADRDLERLIGIVDRASELNDFEKVVIYGSATAQTGNMDSLLEHIIDRGYEVSCSSFRADYLSTELLSAIKRGGQKTLTLAPETGDEDLRLALNKKMSDNSIFTAIKKAWDLGFRQLKLYNIYGFPCESNDTNTKTVEFVKKIRNEHFPKGKISISMNQVITKANTPFQYTAMLTIKKSKEIQKWFRKQIYQIKNAEINFYEPEWAGIQRILSIRDQKYFPVIERIANLGNSVGKWKQQLKVLETNLDTEMTWHYEIDDEMPWDNINHTLSKKSVKNAFIRFKERRNC